MVQIDVPAAFAIGSLFADVAKRQLQTGEPRYYYSTFYKSLIYQIFFFSWIPVYFLLNYFGWETTHMWWHEGSVTAYPLYVPVFMVVFFLAAVIGFKVGTALVRKGKIIVNRMIYIIVAIYSGIWIFGQTGSTFRLGTYEEWKAGTAPLFYQDKTFLVMFIFAVLVWAIALAIFLLKLCKEGTKLDT